MKQHRILGMSIGSARVLVSLAQLLTIVALGGLWMSLRFEGWQQITLQVIALIAALGAIWLWKIALWGKR